VKVDVFSDPIKNCSALDHQEQSVPVWLPVRKGYLPVETSLPMLWVLSFTELLERQREERPD